MSIFIEKKEVSKIYLLFVKKNGFEVFLEIEEDDYKYDQVEKRNVNSLLQSGYILFHSTYQCLF